MIETSILTVKGMTLALQKNIVQLVLRVVSCLILIIALPVSAGDFTVDGCFECGPEQYTHAFEVNYNLNGNPYAKGYLYFGQADVDDGMGGLVSHQFMYFKMAEEYVDTIYGAPADSLDSGWTSGHTFKQILTSDALGSSAGYFKFIGQDQDLNGLYITDTTEIAVDLLACVGGKGKECINGESTYTSGGWGNVANTGQNDGSVIEGDPGTFIVDVKTSMDNNVKLVGFNTTNSLTSNTGWESHVGYEFEFSSNIFGDLDALTTEKLTAMLDLGDSHASPFKIDLDHPVIGPPVDVPEPSSMAIFALGLAGLVATRRKQGQH